VFLELVREIEKARLEAGLSMEGLIEGLRKQRAEYGGENEK
jgi:hypothetical protein